MALSRDLFLSILSMDAYNRGYEPGIALDDHLSIGSAMLLDPKDFISDSKYDEWQPNDFYAHVYRWNGETIIAYRGTDEADGELLAVDFPIAFQNDFDEAEVHLASQFYRSVLGLAGNPDSGIDANNISLTGHSLGGGLAGFVGALEGRNAFGVASIGFFPAFLNFKKLIDRYIEIKDDPVLSVIDFVDLPGMGLHHTVSFAEEQLAAMGIPLENMLDLNGELQFWKSIHASGEGAELSRTAQTPSTPILESVFPDLGATVGIANAHSASFTVIMKFVEDEYGAKGDDAVAFQSIKDSLFNALFDDEVAQKAGSEELSGQSGEATKVRDAIAYSALDEGTLVFGNTGIRALFDDANELGKLIDEDKAPMGYTRTEDRLAEAIVQFAGQMALGKVIYNNAAENPEDGFLTVYEQDRLLKADLTKELWTLNDSGGVNIKPEVEVKGIQDILQDFFHGDFAAKDPAAEILLAGMDWLYLDNTISDSSVINRIDFVLGTDALNVQLSESTGNEEMSLSTAASLFVALGTEDVITGNDDNNIILGKGDKDQLHGNKGKDFLVGGEGDDTLYGGSGWDILHGGDILTTGAEYGEDTADYSKGDGDTATPDGITIDLNVASSLELEGFKSIVVSNDGYGDTDHLFAIEKIVGTEKDDTVKVSGGNNVVQASSYALSTGELEIDGAGGKKDTLDFENFSGSLIATRSENDTVVIGDLTFKNFEIYKDADSEGKIGEVLGERAHAHNFEQVSNTATEIYGNAGKDHLIIGVSGEQVEGGADDDVVVARNASGATLDGGTGDDLILSFGGQNTTIFGGAGDDEIYSSTPGTRVHGGEGADTFYLSNHTLIEDATPEDRISYYGQFNLHGGYRHMESESPWAYGASRIRYGINGEGQMVIESEAGIQAGWGATFVANPSVDPVGTKDSRTAGILLFEYDMERKLLIENDSGEGMYGFFELVFGYMFKAILGESYFAGVDPLVLDLDGDGLELTARTNLSPLFDLDGDGFAEETGWVRPDDGLLVHDINGNGQIDDVTELFGSPTTSGFDELALHDGNADGVIDAQDAIFSDLRVWQDLDQDALVDEGELSTLTDLGIASIALTATPSGQDNSTNLVAETGNFTRTDGTTSEIADVKFRINNYDSVWLGDTTVDPSVAQLPNLKGHGTLVDLHVAMSLDSTGALQSTLESVLPTLNTIDLATLRARILPVLDAWAHVALDASAPAAPVKPDVHAFVNRTAEDTEIVDFAVQDLEGKWFLASGKTVKDANDVVIEEPTIVDILAFLPEDVGAWEIIQGSQITFLERFMGEAIPIDQVEPGNQAAISAFEGILELLVTRLDALAVRLAAQGPLQSYFAGVEYDLESDSLQATTDRDLVPMFEAVFGGAPGTVQGDQEWLSSWNELFDVVFENFQRFGGGHLLNTYSFLFTNVVAAYENVGLAVDLKSAAVLLGIPEEMVFVANGTVVGNAETNMFYLGAGDQVLKGEAGHDIYVVGRDFDHDVIDDYEAPLSANSQDMVRFAHYNPDDLTFTREGIDLVITVNNTTHELRILEHFIGEKPHLFGSNVNPDRGINEIIFADGTVWRAFDIAKAVSHPLDTDQTITGTWEVDYLDGGAGNDVLSGGDGGDLYFFDIGYGHDVVNEQLTYVLVDDPDFLIFGPNLSPEDLSFSRDGDSTDIVITIDATGETLTIQGFAEATYTGPFGTQWFNRIENLVFADGTLMQWDEVLEKIVAAQSTDGDDTIHGFSYEDVLDGGLGNDLLLGGNENDTYIFDVGYGHDTIQENMTRILSGQLDTVAFGPGVDVDHVTFSRADNGHDLIIGVSPTDTLTILNQFVATYTGPFGTLWMERVEYFEFQVNGETITMNANEVMAEIFEQASTDGDDSIYGFSREDVLDGGAGDDYLSGGNESDTYVFGLGYGHDTIEDAQANILSGDTDRVVFTGAITPDDVVLVRDGVDLQFHLTDGSMLTVVNMFNDAGLNVNRIEEFYFEGPDILLSHEDMMARLLDEAQTDGDDVVQGFRWNDRLDAGAGNDQLDGWVGNDTYVFGRGYGHDVVNETGASFLDVVEFQSDITPDDIRIERGNGVNDVRLVIADTGDSLTLQGQNLYLALGLRPHQIEEVRFADDTVWTSDFLREQVIAGEQTDGDDTILGYFSDDIFDGGAGNDRLEGAAGDDTYLFTRGSGDDVVRDYNGNIFQNSHDTIQFGDALTLDDLLVTRLGNDLRFEIQDTGERLTIEDHFSSVNASVERFLFSNGQIVSQEAIENLTLIGTDQDDTITGTTRADLLQGEGGDDTLAGASGSDTYVYDLGDGDDIIDEASDAVGLDRLILGDGITPEDVHIDQSAAQPNDLLMTIQSNQGTILLKDQLSFYEEGIEYLVFADGTTWDRLELSHRAQVPMHVVLGTEADETLYGRAGSAADLFNGAGGDDTLRGQSGWDTYQFEVGSGHDTIDEYGSWADSDILELVGLAQADVTITRNNADLLVTINATSEAIRVDEHFQGRTTGIEKLIFSDGEWDREDMAMALAQHGSTGDETLLGTNAEDVLIGGLGDDELRGGQGSDTYVYTRGDGHDTIVEYYLFSSEDTLFLHNVLFSQVSFERDGLDLTLNISASAQGAGDEGSLLLTSQLDEYFDQGIERIVFDDGTVWGQDYLRVEAIATAISDGDDTIIGFNTDDVIAGGLGNDWLEGTVGDDRYLYSRGDGDDTIWENHNQGLNDQLIFSDVDSDEIQFLRNGNDLTLVIPDTPGGSLNGGSILLQQELDEYFGRGIDTFVFADGVMWGRDDVRVMLLEQNSTDGDDVIVGFNTDDRLVGGLGNDTLQGGTGNDTYTYYRGDGNDLLIEDSTVGGIDHLIFKDVNSTDISVARDGDDVTLIVHPSSVGGVDGGEIVLQHEFANSRFERGIEQFTFSDGAIWDLDNLRDFYIATAPTAGHDTITGFNDRRDDMFGGDGHDVLDGQSGDDRLLGGDGNDELHGGAGADWLLGENGNDTLSGGLGLDLFDGGEGIDTIDFTDAASAVVVDLGAGTTWEAGLVETVIGVENVIGSAHDDRLSGSGGSNILRGDNGSDTYVFGAGSGHDVIQEDGAAADIDAVELANLTEADVSFYRSGQDLLITVLATGETLTIELQFLDHAHGVEGIVFSDGNAWDRDTLNRTVPFLGTDGDDILIGTSADETFNAMLGNDEQQGGAGHDTYRFGIGYGSDEIVEVGADTDRDRLELIELLPADIRFGRVGNDLHIEILASSDMLRVVNHFQSTGNGIEEVVFTNGIIWDRAMIEDESAFLGTDGDDSLNGTPGTDTFLSSPGNDTLDGQNGNDTYFYKSGDGYDQVIDTGTSSGDLDVLQLMDLNEADVALTRTDEDLLITDSATQQVVQIVGQFLSNGHGIELLRFADGTEWTRQAIETNVTVFADALSGTPGPDTLTGTADEDMLIGNGGNDTLYGLDGSDTYVFTQGDGQDVIEDNGYYDTDQLLIHGYTPQAVTLERIGTSNTVAFTFAGTTDRITLVNEINHYSDTIEQIIFDDGTIWTEADLRLRVLSEATTSGNDIITGFSIADVLVGGLGNDTLNGGDGSDTYVFTQGDGQDVIEDNGYYDTDQLLIHGYTPEAVTLERIGTSNTVAFTFAGTTDRITLVNEINHYSDTIEQIIFDDGTIWTEADLRLRVLSEAATSGDDIIEGYGTADTLIGGLGNDTLNGGDGSDTYVFTQGDGQDVIEDNGYYDTDQLLIHGYTPAEVAFGGVAGTVELFFAGTTDRITLVNEINHYSDTIEQIVFDDGTVWTETHLEARRFDGTAGGDTLVGTADADRLTGAAGNDTLTGGLGADTFVFRGSNLGQDTITDFSPGAGFSDHLELDNFATFDDVVAAMSDDGTSTTITLDAEDSITLQNVLMSDLHQDDFQFV